MSLSSNQSLIAKISLQTNTYYVSSRSDIELDDTIYAQAVIGWGDLEYKGNLGNGQFETSSFDLTLVNGEEIVDNGYYFDITDIWNNKECEIRKWTDGDTQYTDTIPIVKGKIKKFNVNNNILTLTIENIDKRDSKKIPAIVCVDQTELTSTERQSDVSKSDPGGANKLIVDDSSIFDVDDFVLLTNYNRDREYAKIKAITSATDTLEFYEDLVNDYVQSGVADIDSVVQKAFAYISKDFINKIVPIQIGNLNTPASGIFGKTVTLNTQIGNQSIITDNIKLKSMESIGAWESGSRRYFRGRDKIVLGSESQGEYEVNQLSNGIDFQIDSTLVLTEDISSEEEGMQLIKVDDYTKLIWWNEDKIDKMQDGERVIAVNANELIYDGTSVFVDEDGLLTPELLSVNVISVGAELMLIVSKPVSEEIRVERGYNDTKITEHKIGDKVFQCAKFSARNLLSFEEKFEIKAVSNQAYAISSGVNSANFTNHVLGSWSNLLNDDTDDYIQFFFRREDGLGSYTTMSYVNWDMRFENIEDDFTIINIYSAVKADYNLGWKPYQPGGDPPILDPTTLQHAFIHPDRASDFGIYIFETIDLHAWSFHHYQENEEDDVLTEIDTYTEIERSSTEIDFDVTKEIVSKPNLSELYDLNTASVGKPWTARNLKDLNKKWKMTVAVSALDQTSNTSYVKVYAVGVWISFFMDFSKQIVVSPLEGRMITSTVTTITKTQVNRLAENPVDVLALLLTQELGYLTTDFTSNWETAAGYYVDESKFSITSPSTEAPKVAFSYGLDDKQKEGWEFCSWLASHFNLQIIKDYSGLIDIVNLHEIYYNTPVGYEINVDDILFLKENSQRRITVYQTGTDLIYNDIQIKYQRNNSTDKYQKVYILPATYTLEKSSSTLSTVRTNFYGDKKTLTIESPFIYTDLDAQRLAEWIADDQAEAHFLIDMFIDFSHYSDVNSLSNQYKIGDIIYLTGKHNGITFTIDRKFYIQNIFIRDSARELEIQAKSVDPVTTF